MTGPSASSESWAPPRELMRALPREISMTGSGKFIATLAIVLVLGSIPLFLIFHYANTRDNAWATALRTEGRETAGQIVRLWQTGGKSHTRMVAYTFTVNGVSVGLTEPSQLGMSDEGMCFIFNNGTPKVSTTF
jgi:hypothetical protein